MNKYFILVVIEIQKVKFTFLTGDKNFNMEFLLATLKRQLFSFFWASPLRSFNKVLIKRLIGIIKTYIKF